MEQTPDVRVALEAAAGVLWRCAVIGFAVLLFWFLMYLAAGGWMIEIHQELFDLDQADLMRMHYAGMGLLKLAVFLLFLTFYVSIRWCLSRNSDEAEVPDR